MHPNSMEDSQSGTSSYQLVSGSTRQPVFHDVVTHCPSASLNASNEMSSVLTLSDVYDLDKHGEVNLAGGNIFPIEFIRATY